MERIIEEGQENGDELIMATILPYPSLPTVIQKAITTHAPQTRAHSIYRYMPSMPAYFLNNLKATQ